MIVTAPIETSDDLYYGLVPDIPSPGTILETLPKFAGTERTVCEFNLPYLGKITLPGLNSPMFSVKVENAWASNKKPLGLQIVKLPKMHSFANQAQRAAAGKRAGDYNYFQTGVSIRLECIHMVSYLLTKNALRTKEGLGWMALSQANPNLPTNVIQISDQLADELFPILHEKKPLVFQSRKDMNGLKMSVVIRFPATTSQGVRTDMILVVGGPGRAVYLNPFVLKYGFVGDVDGDLFFMAINALLRKTFVDPTLDLALPRAVYPSNFQGDLSLTDLGNPPEPSDWETYMGLAGKDGIGEITNACYRAAAIARICFQTTRALRAHFIRAADRPDLEALVPNLKTGTEEQQRRAFRCFASLCVMDEFTPFYELTFDLRKEIWAAPYLEHLLQALRRPDQNIISWPYLRQVVFNGSHIRLKVLPLIWQACEGRLAGFLNAYPVVRLQFGGRGVTSDRKTQVATILDLVRHDPASFFERELRGETHTRVERPPV